jgi:predicted ABC-type ATPase
MVSLPDENPRVVVIAGPNGAGKSTVMKNVLNGPLTVSEFVNADVIARGLSGLDPDRVAMAAGRIMLDRLTDLANQRQSFAFESTLSSRTFIRRLRNLTDDGYELHLVFVWVDGADCCVSRVADRVRLGGHLVPEEDVRRRYFRSIDNFLRLYRPIARSWQLVENTGVSPVRIASGGQHTETVICHPERWSRFESESVHVS